MWLNNLFLPVKAYILRLYVYLLATTLAPQIQVAATHKILVFAENFGLPAFLDTARTQNQTFHGANIISFSRLCKKNYKITLDFIIFASKSEPQSHLTPSGQVAFAVLSIYGVQNNRQITQIRCRALSKGGA